MSGGGTSSTTTSVPEWAVPYGQQYLARASQVADLPYQQYTGQRTAGLNGVQQSAMGAIQQRAMQGSPVMNSAAQTLQDTASGQYLGAGNPYLQQQVDAANADTVRAYIRATNVLVDACVDCGMPTGYPDHEAWAAERVTRWLVEA